MTNPFKDHHHCRQGLIYATKIVDREIPAGKYTIASCQRHIDNLAASDFPFYFDPAAAEKACKFIELMPHTKGIWARRKETIKLMPWMQFAITTLFGWKRKADDTRRFREAYLSMARKSAKSILAAAIGEYMFCADEEYGAEVYSGATSEKQAWEVFKPARLMAVKTPALRDAYSIKVHAKAMSIPEDGSKFEPIIGKPGDGSSPSCAIIDEYHEHDSPDMYDTMVTGTGARSQPLILIITTAGFDISSPCFKKEEEIKAVLDGTFEDDEKFGLIYHTDDSKEWLTEEGIYKANPSVGTVVPLDFFKARQQEGRISKHKQNAIKTKYFNMWVNARETYFNIENWNVCEDKSLQFKSFLHKEVICGADLASKQDFVSVIFLYKSMDSGYTKYYLKSRHYLPQDTIVNEHTKRYHSWVISGAMEACGDKEIDFQVILDDIREYTDKYNITEIAYDPHQARHFAQMLSDEGATMVEFHQRPSLMGQPMDELCAAIDSGRIVHDGNPVMSWMMSNVINSKPRNKMPYPGKQVPANKIDGAVAAIMAIGRAMENDNDSRLFGEYLATSQN